MALTTSTIREGIKATIDAAEIDGLRAYAYNSDAPQPPCAMVLFPASLTPATYGGGWDYAVPVQVLVQRITDARSQDRLDVLLAEVTDLFDGASFTWGSTEVQSVDGIGDVPGEQPMTAATINLLVRA